jgi:hypothetical protein
MQRVQTKVTRTGNLRQMKAAPLYETGDYWVAREPSGKGFEVWRNGPTAATRCAQIGYAGDEGLQRAKREADRRSGWQKATADIRALAHSHRLRNT